MKRRLYSDDDSDFAAVDDIPSAATAKVPKRLTPLSDDDIVEVSYTPARATEPTLAPERKSDATNGALTRAPARRMPKRQENCSGKIADLDNTALCRLQAQQQQLESDLAEIDREMTKLKRKRATKASQLRTVQEKLDDAARNVQQQRNERLRSGYEQPSFPWSDTVHGLLRGVFGIQNFRDNQEAVINATLDNRDVVVIMPTGGGKSLCFQLPALVSPGLTLVVSPLIALMVDQVLQLKEIGVNAEALTSESFNPKAINDKIRQLYSPAKRRVVDGVACEDSDELRLLYVSPEKIVGGKRLLPMIEKVHEAGKLRRIVIDECHCVSEYGNDFRSDYKNLGKLKYTFKNVPLIALSATCPPRVLSSVCETLGIDGGAGRPRAIVYTSPLWRQNLRYSVERKAEGPQARLEQTLEWITERHAGSRGIVYCSSKDTAYNLAILLQTNDTKCYQVGLYHADLERAHKEQLQGDWRAGRLQIVVATNAFGMGINSLDVRFVVHLTAPKTLENYYQESGRAGRDGKPADCVLFYRSPDSSDLARWGFDGRSVEGLTKARAMVSYAECTYMCRKVLLQSYLQDASGHPGSLQDVLSQAPMNHASGVSGAAPADGAHEPIEVCGECDVCQLRPQIVAVDCTPMLISVVNIVRAAGDEQLTLIKLATYCRGNGLKKAPRIGELADRNCARFIPKLSLDDWGYIASQLVAAGVLAYKFSHTAHTTIAYLGLSGLYEGEEERTLDQAGATDPFIIRFASTALPEALLEYI